MKIKYLGHSSFTITADNGTVVLCDPYSAEVGFNMPEVEADVVTISHHHFDHDYIKAAVGSYKLADGISPFTVNGVSISGVSCYHDDCGGKKRGQNVIFKIRTDGVCVCHLGDVGERCSEDIAEAIGKVDVLLVPVGGNYTIDAYGAKEYVEALKPSVVIPMHYKTEGCNIDIKGADGFLSLFEGEEDAVCERCGSEVKLTADDIRLTKNMRVLVMERCGK